MAATKLIAMHHLKGKTIKQCLKDRIEYSLNPVKTENGEYTSYYECTPEAVVEEFALAKRQYEFITGRTQNRGVIAYMIRQSFKPGEIEPEEANKIGYELAMRFTKGKHMFFVATHTDREHIHNHVIFNSTTLDCTRKFKNFFLSGKTVQKLSDLICIENNLSIIQEQFRGNKTKDSRYREIVSKRDIVKRDLDLAMQKNPGNMEELLELLKCQGYQVKKGKYIAIKGKGQERFFRLNSLGSGYTQEDIEKVLVTGIRIKKKKGYQKSLSLLIDIQEKINEGKGGGYANWAKVFNVKQMAQTILFLQEHDFESYDQLDAVTREIIDRYHALSEQLKYQERELEDYKKIKRQVINYSKTRDIYVEYRNTGFDGMFLEKHKEEIQIYKDAMSFFDKIDNFKIPKIQEVNCKISETYVNRKNLLDEYYKLKEEIRRLMIVRENVKNILETNSATKHTVPTKEAAR